MPRRFRKGRRTRRKKGSSFGKKLLRQARTSRVDSAAELAIKIIAKREAKKLSTPNLILRNYWFADYNLTSNTFGNVTNLDRGGKVVSLCQIALQDNAVNTIAQAAAQVLDQDMRPTPNHQYYNQVIAPVRAQDGYRLGPSVMIKNVTIGLKVGIPRLTLAQREPPLRKYCTVFWRIVAVSEIHAAQVQPGHEPTYQELHSLPVWGYSSRLDKTNADVKQGMKVRVLLKGKKVFNYSIDHDRTQTLTMFKDLGKGILMEYFAGVPNSLTHPTGVLHPADLYGQRVTSDWKIYLAIASDIDAGMGAEFKPRVAAFTKVGYKNIV